MRKWEYKVLFVALSKDAEDRQRLCNALGRDGWELVSVVAAYETDSHLFFKRRCSSRTGTLKKSAGPVARRNGRVARSTQSTQHPK